MATELEQQKFEQSRQPYMTEDEITQMIKDGIQVFYLKPHEFPRNSLVIFGLSINGGNIDRGFLDPKEYDVSALYNKSNPKYYTQSTIEFGMYPNETLNKVLGNMVYGNDPQNCSDNYYLEMILRNDGKMFMYAKYQSIIGSRLLGELTDEHQALIKRRAKLMFDDCLSKIIPKKEITDNNDSIDNKKPAQASLTNENNDISRRTSGPISRIIPALKSVTFVNPEATELKLNGQMDPKDYAVIKKVFEDMGGKWNRSSGTHIFKETPMDRIFDIIQTGKFEKTYNLGYFPTPPNLTDDVIMPTLRENYFPGMRILEPSIGQGHIADKIKAEFPDADIVGIELNPENFKISNEKHNCIFGDFLAQTPPAEKFDAVIMNPPFEKQQDIKHVEHAMEFLKPGGLMIAIMASSVDFRTDKRTTAFREMVTEMGGLINENPEGAFKSSGTSVNTVTVTMYKQPELKKSIKM